MAEENHFNATKADVPPPTVPGSNDPTWTRALKATGFFDFTTRSPARLVTEARLLYDDKNLYIAFHCAQPHLAITAVQRVDHAGLGNDDYVAFAIDTAGNGTRTYTFRANPEGVHDETATENARYTPPWRSLSRIYDGGYDVLMVVPLADIRAHGGASQAWRFNFERFIAALNELDTWAYEPAMQSPSSPQFWPWLTDIRISATVTRPRPQADAYLLASAGSQHNVFQAGIEQFEQMSPRTVGIDITYPLTNTLAFVGTINPDFSNVEQDQITIRPQTFQQVFTEYRPFFSQGAQYINSVPSIGAFGGPILFYSPSIGVFSRGLKIEGTSGRNAFGALNALGPGIDDTAVGYAYTTRDGDVSVSAQGVFADHSGTSDRTIAYGFTRLNRSSGEGAQMELADETNAQSGLGHDLNLTEGLHNQHFNLAAYYRDTSPGFAPLDGYTANNDARGPGATIGYNGAGSSRSQVLAYSFYVIMDRQLAHDGSVREADINAFYNVQFKNLLSVQGFAGPSELQITPGVVQWFNGRQIEVGYRAGTPNPTVITYTWGSHAGYWLQEIDAAASRSVGDYSATVEYAGNIDRASANAPITNSQWLRKVSLLKSLDRNASFGFSIRNINGTGGFALPGTNISLLYQRRFTNQDLMYVEFGTPASVQTLHRFIIKYVFHAGGATGS